MTYEPPREQAKLMQEEWSNVTRAWNKIYELRSPLRSRLDLARLTYEFGNMGCNILGRQQKWSSVIEWTNKAQQIIKELETTKNRYIEYCEVFTLWHIDALLQEGQVSKAFLLIQERTANSRVRSRWGWRLRYRVRQIRCTLLGSAQFTFSESFCRLLCNSLETSSLKFLGEEEWGQEHEAEAVMLASESETQLG